MKNRELLKLLFNNNELISNIEFCYGEEWMNKEYETPLPKGHGRLIDADKLIKKLEATANIEWNMQVGSSKGLIDAIDIVDDTPTIIEADKGSD